MKKVKLFLVVGVLLLGAAACIKNYKYPVSSGNVSGDEAADMIAASFSYSSDGVADLAEDASFEATTLVTTHVPCGTAKADSVSAKSTAGASTTFSYSKKYTFTVNCANNVPDSLSSNLVYSGSFSGPNLSSSNSGSSIFTVNGLLPAAANFVINGEYKRTGSFASKIDTSNHGTSNIDIIISGLTLTKPNRAIMSGTATIVVTGDVPKKGNFSYNGYLVFNGNGTATLTLNGNVYTINLYTGQRTHV